MMWRTYLAVFQKPREAGRGHGSVTEPRTSVSGIGVFFSTLLEDGISGHRLRHGRAELLQDGHRNIPQVQIRLPWAPIGKEHSGHELWIDAVIGEPAILIIDDHFARNRAQGRLPASPIARPVSDNQVRRVTGQRPTGNFTG